MARSSGRRATRLVAATGAIAEELGRLAPDAPPERMTVIENGADFDDFEGLGRGPEDDGRMTIVHAGSFFGKRTPRPLPAGAARAARPPPGARRHGCSPGSSARCGPRTARPPPGSAWTAPGRRPASCPTASAGGAAGGRRAAAADPRRGRPRRHVAVGQGVRVHRRRPADPGRRPAGRHGRRPGAPQRIRRGGRRRGRGGGLGRARSAWPTAGWTAACPTSSSPRRCARSSRGAAAHATWRRC